MPDIVVNQDLTIGEGEFREDFVRSSGPGGQNVNKVATTVQLRFDIAASTLPIEIKHRLTRIAGRRVDRRGILRIEARRFRTRERNRKDARQRLAELIGRATEPPKERRPTRPTPRSRHRRLEGKRQTAEKKARRGRVAPDDA